MIRVLVVDDHAIVRGGIKQILADTTDIVAAGEAENGRQALEKIGSEDYDIILLDLSMPGQGGLETLGEIRKEKPKLPVIVLTMYPEDQYAVRTLRAGASGYLTKGSLPEDLIRAIRQVHGGRRFITAAVAEQLAGEIVHDDDKSAHERLSDREYQIFLMIAAGKTVSGIADELCLSVKTVSTYRARILEKMELKNNSELVHYAYENHLVQ